MVVNGWSPAKIAESSELQPAVGAAVGLEGHLDIFEAFGSSSFTSAVISFSGGGVAAPCCLAMAIARSKQESVQFAGGKVDNRRCALP